MPGEKRRVTQCRVDPRASLHEENQSLRKAAKKLRTRRVEGLADSETHHLVDDDSLFTERLAAAGYFVKKRDKENILTEDQAIFTKKFKYDVTSNYDYPDNVTKMLDTFIPWLDDESFLIKCLRPTKTSTECPNARSAMQASLLRLLLNIEDFQPRLMKVLLEKLAEISCEAEVRQTADNVPRLILTAIRWLDVLVDGAGLVEKMQEILEVASDNDRVDVIMALPEILPQSQHDTIAAFFHQELGGAKTPAAIVDCFVNLSLSPQMIAATQLKLTENLPRFECSVLPAVVEYLLSSCSAANCEDVISRLRTDLDLTAKVRPSQRAGPASQKNKDVENKKKVERRILDKIGLFVAIEKTISAAWLKAVKESDEMMPLDFLVITLMYKNKENRKVLVKMMTAKVRSGILTEALVISTFEKHCAALQQNQFLVAVLEVAVSLFTCPAAAPVGKQIFISAFTELDQFSRLEIVNELSLHVTRNDVALSALSQLSLHHPDLLSPFCWCLMPLLDQLSDDTDIAQIRLLITLLARLTWADTQSDAGQRNQDVLVIFVKKQVNSGIRYYRRIGVVGAVICARAMISASSRERGVDMFEDPTGQSSKGSLLAEAQELLSFAKQRTEFDPHLAGLLLDELGVSLLTDDETCIDFIIQISEGLLKTIETEYSEEVEQIDYHEFSLIMTSGLGLSEEETTVTLAKKVLQAVDEVSFSSQKKKTTLAKMVPTLRLLVKSKRMIASVTNVYDPPPLDDMDALLSNCLLIFPQEVLDTMSSHSLSEKNSICSTYFYAINWLIEIINAFSTEEDIEIRNLVLLRMKQIITLRETVQRLLKSNPMFRPPTALFFEDHSHWKPPGTNSPVKKNIGMTVKGKGRGKRSKMSVNKTVMTPFHTQGNTQASQTQTQLKNELGVVDLKHYRIFFREFDLSSVLSIIKNDPVTAEPAPGYEDLGSPKLRPAELLFLLNDLHLKLENTIVKKKGFLGKQNLSGVGFTNLRLSSQVDIMEAVMKHFSHIFNHLDNLKEHFDSSELRDDLGSPLTKDTILFMECVKVGLQTTTSFISCWALNGHEKEEILRNSLVQIVYRDAELREDTSVPVLLSEALKYLSSFSACSLTADVAAVHLTLMATLAQLTEDDAGNKIVTEAASHYLQEDWKDVTGEQDRGSLYNRNIEALLSIFVKSCGDTYSALSSLCSEGTSFLMQRLNSTQPPAKYPFISKATLNTVYKIVLPALVTEVKKMTYGPTKDVNVQYSQWSMALAIFVTMITDLEKTRTTPLLKTSLKHSGPFISHFVREGLALIEKNFSSNKKEKIDLIMRLQKATRYLQRICNQVKISENVAMSRHVPAVRKCLEDLIFRVKAMLRANNCQDLLVVGTRKNRNIEGEEILSQEDSEDNSEEEEHVGDEDGDEVESEREDDVGNDVRDEV